MSLDLFNYQLGPHIYSQTEIEPPGNVRVLYRYVDTLTWNGSVAIECHWHVVVKETPCGVWINSHSNNTSKCLCDKKGSWWKFVNLQAYKKWAHPTKEDAYNSFVQRKRRQKKIISKQLARVNSVLEHIKEENNCDD